MVNSLCLPQQSEYAKLTPTLSRRQGLLPLTQARQSVRPPEIKGRACSQFGIQALVGPQRWQQPIESSLAVVHRPLLQASASKKSSFMCHASHCFDSLSSWAEEPLGFSSSYTQCRLWLCLAPQSAATRHLDVCPFNQIPRDAISKAAVFILFTVEISQCIKKPLSNQAGQY